MIDTPMIKRRFTIGVLWDSLMEAYDRKLFAGILAAAERHDVNIICLAGGLLNARNKYEAQRNVLFDLVSKKTVDGLMILMGVFNNVSDPLEIRLFCERYRPLPITGIALRLKGIPTVLVDNDQGMRDLVTHLIEVHGHRRIAFIRGPRDAYDAQKRYQVYCDVLIAHGLPLEPALVAQGDFLIPSGAAAVSLLLDDRQTSFDAIIGTNDNMAIGAIEALQARGVNVPEQVAVVGFDDNEGANLVTPPLTTVRQPLYEQGQQALELVLAQLRGEPVPAEVVLPTRVVIRQSCGCFSAAARRASQEPGAFERQSGELGMVAGMARAVAQAVGASSDSDPRWRWAERLVRAFAAEVGGEKQGEFLAVLSQILDEVSGSSEVVMSWQDGLSALRGLSLAGGVRLAEAESLWHAARVLVAEAAQRRDAAQRLQLERRTYTMNYLISPALMGIVGLADFVQALAEGLPRLDIRQCYLALYEDPQYPSGWARLILAYDERGRIDIGVKGERFQSTELVPRRLLQSAKPYNLIVQPLYFREQQQGFVLFEMKPGEGVLYEQLREQISTTLKGALLGQTVLDREVERERLLENLAEQTVQLEQAYVVLKENQVKLLTAEKMASLGRLTAGIAHEMNTPLAAARLALFQLNELVQDCRASFENLTAPSSERIEIINEMRHLIQLANQAAEQATGFIHGIEFQTSDLAGQAHQWFEVAPLIEETLLRLSQDMRWRSSRVELEAPTEAIKLHGVSRRLAEVITHLVTNAVEASMSKSGGSVKVRLQSKPPEVILEISDRGMGILPAHLPKIFDPMFTTKPFGQRMGLGLAVVHHIVVAEFGGTIEVASELGEGTTFTMHFPQSAEEATVPSAYGNDPALNLPKAP